MEKAVEAWVGYTAHGTMAVVVVLTMVRVVLGSFFAISGWHKLTNRQRHAAFAQTLVECRVPAVWLMCWVVAGVEFGGGVALILGLATPLAALALVVVCTVATLTDGVRRVHGWNPIDGADEVADLEYLPEVLYVLMLLTVLASGPGPASVDGLVARQAQQHMVLW